jgi:hypothetical protein
MLTVSQDFFFFIAPSVFPNIWQHRVHKTQEKQMSENTEGLIKEDNPEKLAT